jgi:hypothetical protein
MKIILRITLIFLVLFASCEKITDQPYTLKFYGDAYEDIGYSVTIVSDGYVVAGQVTDIRRSGGSIVSSDKNMGVIKTGWDGNIVWKVSAGGKFDDKGTKIYQNEDGSLICVGTFTDTTGITPGETDMFIVKISSAGTIEWKKTYGGTGNQTGIDIAKTTDGYLIMGSTDIAVSGADSTGNIAGNKDISLIRILDNGNYVETSQPYGFSGDDEGVAIKPTNDGKFIIFATTDRSEPGQGQGKDNLFLIKVNPSGNLIYNKILGGPEDEYAADIEVLPDGYLIAYNVGKDGENQEIYVEKLKEDLFAAPAFLPKKISITNPNSTDASAKVYALTKYKTDSFILSGNSGKSTAAKMLIFEIDTLGTLVEGHQMIKGSTGVQIAYDVVAGDDGYIIAVGKNSYDVNSMITFLKFKF